MGHRRGKAYLQPYRDAVERHGPGFEATLWNSREAQLLRFDVMIGLADFTDATLLDVGCGRGDFAARLIERGVAVKRYIGLDAVEEMVKAAAGRGLPRSEFVCADPVAEPGVLARFSPDFVCISGTMNTMDDVTAETLVRGTYEAARRAVLFNFLSSRFHARREARDTAPARRFDPVRWLDFALGLGSRVTFTQAYLDGHDATVMVEKN